MAHYRLLDFLRFLAALAVALFHWKLFMFEQDWGTVAPASDLPPPLLSVLGPVYDYGNYAVPFFWMLSGFVFAFVYGAKQISFSEFALRRFARLYPLAVLTLAIVAYLQGVLMLRFGETFFYGENDLYHYVLNLLFISAWGFEQGLSFNGPLWSVSAEIPIYILFWATVRYLPMNAVTCLGMAAIFFLLQDIMTFTKIDYCGLMFFIGAAIFYICKMFRPGHLLALSLAAWMGGGVLVLQVPAIQTVGTLMLLIAFAPLLAATSALDRMWSGRQGAIDQAGALGDLSYAIYLLHVPVMLALAFCMVLFDIDRIWLYGNIPAMLAYLGVTVWLSYVVFRWYEQPLRLWLTNTFSTRTGTLRPTLS